MNYTRLIFSFLFCLMVSNYSHSDAILKDLRGQAISFSSLKGKWVFINYWASWCQPCLDEIPEFNHFYKKNKNRVALFAVNFDHLSLTKLNALTKKYKMSYPSLQYNPARALGLGPIQGVPATFVFNPKGKLTATLYGGQTMGSLNRSIR